MAVQITVLIDKTPGTMSRVIASLRRFGLTFGGHHIETAGDHSQLTVLAAGHATERELTTKLGELRGVVQVQQIAAGAEDLKRSAKPASAPAQPRVEAPVNGSGQIADQIAAAYPKIMRLLMAYEGSIPSRERATHLQALGEQVGIRLVADNEGLTRAETLHEAVEQTVVPVLQPIAEAEAVGSDIRVRMSVFTRRQVNTMDLVMGGEAERCDFMTGLIRGILNSAHAMPTVQVKESLCRTNGDEYCLFEVSA